MDLALRTSTEAVPPLSLLPPQPVKHATQNMTARRMDTILLMGLLAFFCISLKVIQKNRSLRPRMVSQALLPSKET